MQQGLVSKILEAGQTSARNLKDALNVVKTNLEDRYKVIDFMAESLVQVSIPLTHRYFMHLAEQDDSLTKSTEKSDFTVKDDWHSVPEHIKSSAIETLKNEANKIALKNYAVKLRKSVKKFFSYKTQIQRQVIKLDQFFCEQVIPNITPNVFVNFFKWVNSVFYAIIMKNSLSVSMI